MGGGWGVGGLLTYLVTATVYSIYMPFLLGAETVSCRLDVALRLFRVSEH